MSNPSKQLSKLIKYEKEKGNEPSWEMVERSFSGGYSYGYADGTTGGITIGLGRSAEYLESIVRK